MKTWVAVISIQIILAMLLFWASTWIVNFLTSLMILDYARWGVPFVFFETWGPCRAGMGCSAFHEWALLGDVAICYVISVIAVTWFRWRKR